MGIVSNLGVECVMEMEMDKVFVYGFGGSVSSLRLSSHVTWLGSCWHLVHRSSSLSHIPAFLTLDKPLDHGLLKENISTYPLPPLLLIIQPPDFPMAENTPFPTPPNNFAQSAPNPIDSLLYQNRYQIQDAYEGSTHHTAFGPSTPSCPWNVCIKDASKPHTHLHRAGTGNCSWHRCEKSEAHIHKYKPPPPLSLEQQDKDKDLAGRYNRVQHAVKSILGSDYTEEEPEPAIQNVFLRLENERKAEEAEKERKAKRLADAERAGDEAKRAFEDASAARRAKRGEDRKRALEIENVEERKRLKRRAARGLLAMELETGNEVEGTFDLRDINPTKAQAMRDAQLGIFDSSRLGEQAIQGGNEDEEAGDEGPSAIAVGKRKRADSPISNASSQSGLDAGKGPSAVALGKRKRVASSTSSLTNLDAGDLDMIIEQETLLGGEGARFDGSAHDTPHASQSRTSAPTMSSKKRKRANSNTSNTSSLTDLDAADLDMILKQETISNDKSSHPAAAKPKAGRVLRPRASAATAPQKKKQRVAKPASDTSSLTDLNASELDKLIEQEAPSATASTATEEGGSSPQTRTSDLTSYNLEELDALLGGAEVVIQEANSTSPPYHSPWSTPPQSPSHDLDLENMLDRELRSSIADGEAVASPYVDIRGPSTPPALMGVGIDGEAPPATPCIQGLMPPPPVSRQSLDDDEDAEESVELEEQRARRRQIQWVLKDPRYKLVERRKWGSITIFEDPEDGIEG